MSTQEIRCEQICKHFGRIEALKNVDICFPKGTISGLIGRNGAGKTTLLNIISNRLAPTQGIVQVDGLSAFENDAVLQKIHHMSVANFFPPECKVKQAFLYARRLSRDFDLDAAYRYADAFELPVKRKIRKLSTGMQAAFKIALTLASNADYLLLDEPVLGLDANSRDLFYRLLIEKQAETDCGIVLSTHLIEEVAPLLEEIVLLDRGAVLLHAPVEDLLSNHYILSGPEAAVRAYAADKHVISEKKLGSHLALGLSGLNLPEDALPSSLQIAPYTLQALVVDLTGTPLNHCVRKESEHVDNT